MQQKRRVGQPPNSPFRFRLYSNYKQSFFVDFRETRATLATTNRQKISGFNYLVQLGSDALRQ